MSELKDDLAALRIERTPDASPRRGWIGWAIAAIVLLALGFAGWSWAMRERTPEVQVGAVTARAAGTQASVLNASGYVTARRRATVSSKVTGKVIEVNVEEGMAVKEGQILARLDDSTPRATLALTQAQLEAAHRAVDENEVRLHEARVTLDRQQRLRRVPLVGSTGGRDREHLVGAFAEAA